MSAHAKAHAIAFKYNAAAALEEPPGFVVVGEAVVGTLVLLPGFVVEPGCVEKSKV